MIRRSLLAGALLALGGCILDLSECGPMTRSTRVEGELSEGPTVLVDAAIGATNTQPADPRGLRLVLLDGHAALELESDLPAYESIVVRYRPYSRANGIARAAPEENGIERGWRETPTFSECRVGDRIVVRHPTPVPPAAHR